MTAATMWFPHLPTAAVGGNARGHWAQAAAETKRLRADACFYARQQLRGVRFTSRVLATVQVFTPRVNTRRDWDNYLKRLKPVFDGVVEAGVLLDDDAAHLVAVPADPLFVAPGKQGEGVLITFEGGQA
jgi:Holliday junction resolvase RusA-like endonuclease